VRVEFQEVYEGLNRFSQKPLWTHHLTIHPESPLWFHCSTDFIAFPGAFGNEMLLPSCLGRQSQHILHLGDCSDGIWSRLLKAAISLSDAAFSRLA